MLQEICKIVDGPISAEVIATDYDGIVKEGRELAKMHENIVVKVPLIAEGLKAVRTFSAEGIKTNVTVTFSPLQAMLAAKCVGYSTGPSGVYIQTVWKRWGVAPRSVEAPPAVPVASLLARGDADLGLQQLSELMGQPGIDIVGPLPEPIQKITVFSAAVSTTSLDPEAAMAFLRFLGSSDAHATIEKFGMTPFGKR